MKSEHELAILAWCLMPNHDHLVVRAGLLPLWRSMQLVQGGYKARLLVPAGPPSQREQARAALERIAENGDEITSRNARWSLEEPFDEDETESLMKAM